MIRRYCDNCGEELDGQNPSAFFDAGRPASSCWLGTSGKFQFKISRAYQPGEAGPFVENVGDLCMKCLIELVSMALLG